MKRKIEFDKFKISFTNHNVYQSGDIVIAIISGYAKTPTLLQKTDDEWMFPYETALDMEAFRIEGVGVAKLAPNDKFDFEKGKKIALAKAENNAYKKMAKKIMDRAEELKTFIEQAEKFKEKVDGVVNHNLQYINDVDNGTTLKAEA